MIRNVGPRAFGLGGAREGAMWQGQSMRDLCNCSSPATMACNDCECALCDECAGPDYRCGSCADGNEEGVSLFDDPEKVSLDDDADADEIASYAGDLG